MRMKIVRVDTSEKREHRHRKNPVSRENYARDLFMELLRLGLARFEVLNAARGSSEFCFDGMRWSINKGESYVNLGHLIGWGKIADALAEHSLLWTDDVVWIHTKR